MAVIGADAGSLNTKVVVMDDSGVLSRSMVNSSVPDAAKKAIDEALKATSLSRDSVGTIISTGIGKKEVEGATGQATEIVCDARGVGYFFDSVGMAVDMGAESSRAIRCDPAGNVVEFALNDKCAAGTGIFLDSMAKALRVPVDKMGALSLKSTQEVNITAMCVVFAESEVVSQIHKKMPREDIINGINKSIATRVYGMMNRVGVDSAVVAVGGLANNEGVVGWLEKLTGVTVKVPKHPEFVGAVGAALLAAEKERHR